MLKLAIKLWAHIRDIWMYITKRKAIQKPFSSMILPICQSVKNKTVETLRRTEDCQGREEWAAGRQKTLAMQLFCIKVFYLCPPTENTHQEWALK